jgi:hypothetical protein
LNQEIGKLRSENLKLTTDMAVIRTEHSGMSQSMHYLKTRNRELTEENQSLREEAYYNT